MIKPCDRLGVYYHGCQEFDNFIERQNMPDSKIKFKIFPHQHYNSDGSMPYSNYLTESVSTNVAKDNKSIIYTLHKVIDT